MKDKVKSLKPLQKKKRINSRRKGITFENKICKILNERFETKEFCRTPGSGAFATVHNLPKHIDLAGDIIAPEGFKFYLECKKGYNFKISDFYQENSEWMTILDKLILEAKNINKQPLLILQQDRKNILVLVPSDLLRNYPMYESTVCWRKDTRAYCLTLLDEILKLDNSFWFSSYKL